MERSMRGNDRCFRWGGDEFVVVMSDTGRDAAQDLLGRMAQTVGKEYQARDGRDIVLTWGAAEMELDAASAEDAAGRGGRGAARGEDREAALSGLQAEAGTAWRSMSAAA